jgi:hypothetical protein
MNHGDTESTEKTEKPKTEDESIAVKSDLFFFVFSVSPWLNCF